MFISACSDTKDTEIWIRSSKHHFVAAVMLKTHHDAKHDFQYDINFKPHTNQRSNYITNEQNKPALSIDRVSIY